MSTTTTAPMTPEHLRGLSAGALRSHFDQLMAELAADPERKLMRVRGEIVNPGPHRTREVVEAELLAVQQAMPAAEEREQREEAEREQREQREREQRIRVALRAARAAAADAQRAEHATDAAYEDLDELIAASPVGRVLAAEAERRAAAGALHNALAALGPVALYSETLNAAQQALLERLGDDAAAARRALPEGHPARLRPAARQLRHDALIRHLLAPPAPPLNAP